MVENRKTLLKKQNLLIVEDIHINILKVNNISREVLNNFLKLVSKLNYLLVIKMNQLAMTILSIK